MRTVKAPIYKLSRSKAPKTQQICHYSDVRKTSGLFSLYETGCDFRYRDNFANLDFFAKIFVVKIATKKEIEVWS